MFTYGHADFYNPFIATVLWNMSCSLSIHGYCYLDRL